MLPPKPPKPVMPNYDDVDVPWDFQTKELFRKTLHNYKIICNYKKDVPNGARWNEGDIDRILKAAFGIEEEVNKCHRWAKKVYEYGPRPTSYEIKETIGYAKELCHKINNMVDDYELDLHLGPPRKNGEHFNLLADDAYAAHQWRIMSISPTESASSDDFKIKGMATDTEDGMDYVHTLQELNPTGGKKEIPVGPAAQRTSKVSRKSARTRPTKDSWVRERDGAPKRH